MIKRPPRRVLHDITHTWASQAPQYDRPDITPAPGVVGWQVPPGLTPVPVLCLLYYTEHRGRLTLVGILSYFPEGSPFDDEPGDFMVLVHPEWRRQGIGSRLVREAVRRWGVDLMTQCYTTQGWMLAQSILEDPREDETL